MENEVPRTLYEAREVAGSTKYKQSKTAWNCIIRSVFLFSDENLESIFLV